MINRANKDKHLYKRVCMDFAADPRLSWEAKGVMSYLLSKSDDWKIIIEHLINQGGAKRDKVYRMVRELKEAGYLTRERTRNPVTGRIEWGEYHLNEVPPLTGLPYAENPDMDIPFTENPDMAAKPQNASPYTALPDTVKPTLPKVDHDLRTEERAANKTATSEPQQQPPPSETDPLVIYYQSTGVKVLNQIQQRAIREAITSYHQIWQAECERFARNSWNCKNLDNLLDAYRKSREQRQQIERMEAETARRNREEAEREILIAKEREEEEARRAALSYDERMEEDVARYIRIRKTLTPEMASWEMARRRRVQAERAAQQQQAQTAQAA